MPTATGLAAESPKEQIETPHVARIISSDSIPAGGFTPGTILDDRYRIIGLLGRGGMGEVYCADDVKLGRSGKIQFSVCAFLRNVNGSYADFPHDCRIEPLF